MVSSLFFKKQRIFSFKQGAAWFRLHFCASRTTDLTFPRGFVETSCRSPNVSRKRLDFFHNSCYNKIVFYRLSSVQKWENGNKNPPIPTEFASISRFFGQFSRADAAEHRRTLHRRHAVEPMHQRFSTMSRLQPLHAAKKKFSVF